MRAARVAQVRISLYPQEAQQVLVAVAAVVVAPTIQVLWPVLPALAVYMVAAARAAHKRLQWQTVLMALKVLL